MAGEAENNVQPQGVTRREAMLQLLRLGGAGAAAAASPAAPADRI